MTRPSAVLQRIEDAAEGELLRLQYKASRLYSRRRATSRRRGPIISAPLSSRDLAWPSTSSWTPAVTVPRVAYDIVPPSPGRSAPAGAGPPIEQFDTKPLPTAEETADDGLPAPPPAACEFIDVFDQDHSHDAIAPEEKHLAHQLLHKASSNLGDALFALDEVALIFSEEDHDERRGRQAAGKWRGPSTIEELRMLREAVKEVHKAFSMTSFEVVAVVRQVGPPEKAERQPQQQQLQPEWDSRLSSATCQTKASHYSSASELASRGSVNSGQSASTWTSWGAPPSYGHDSQAAGWTPGWSLNSRAPSTQCDYPPPDRAGSAAGPARTHSRPLHIDSIDPLDPSIPLHLRRRPSQHQSSIARPTLAARRLSRKPPIHPRAQHGPQQHQQQRTTVVSPLRITPRIASVPAEYLSPGIHTAISEQIEVLRSPSTTATAVDLLLTPKATEMNRGIARARARLGEEDAVASLTVPFVLGPYEGEVRRREQGKMEQLQQPQSRKAYQSEVIRPMRPPRRRKPSTIIAGTLCNVPGVGEDDDHDGEGQVHEDTASTRAPGHHQAAPDPNDGSKAPPHQAAAVAVTKPTPHCSVAPLLSPIPGTPCDLSHGEQQASVDDDGALRAASRPIERTTPYTPTRIKPLRLCRQGTDVGRHGPGSLVAGRI